MHHRDTAEGSPLRCVERNAMGAPETMGEITPRSHYMRLSTDGGFLTYPCVLSGSNTNAISLDSVFMYICKTRSDLPKDPSLPEKLKNLTDTCGVNAP